MSGIETRLLRNGPGLSPRGGATTRYDDPGETHIAWARVGNLEGDDDELWARVQGDKVFVNIIFETGMPGDEAVAELPVSKPIELAPGDVVLVALANGDPNNATIIARMDVFENGLPNTVAGVSTGAAAAHEINVEPPPIAPAPAGMCMRTRAGRLLAIESGAGADVVIHSGAGVELKGAAILLDGQVQVGRGFATPPVGATAAPEISNDGITPGTPGVAPVPAPLAIPTLPPYAGAAEAVVRAKDEMQSNAAIDPDFWVWWQFNCAVTGIFCVLAGLTPPPILPPTKLTSRAVTAGQALLVADQPPPE